MQLSYLTIPFILLTLSAVSWLFFFHSERKNVYYKVMAIILIIIVYNEFVLFGHQNFYLYRLTLPLTYTDALVFYLIMPLFYVYLLNLIKERPYLSIKNAKHLWVGLPGFIYSIYFGTLPASQQKQTVYGNSCGLLPDSLLYILGSISIFFYIILSLLLLLRHIEKNKNSLHPQSLQQLNWYVWVLYFYFFLNVCFITLSLLLTSSSEIHSIILSLLILLTLIQFFVVFFIKPEKLTYINQFTTDNWMSENLVNPEIDEATLIVIKKIKILFDEKKLYLKHDINLEFLSKTMKLPGHKISASIKDYYNMTVPDLINNYRIEHAKFILSSEEADQIKIDVLSFECGYASRSNFYRTFKKSTGLTPLEYKTYLFQIKKTKPVFTKT